jgi:transposase
LHHC